VTGPFDSYPSVTVGTLTVDRVDTYEVPVDPMDDLQCESCQ
jgi:hypothetical protein